MNSESRLRYERYPTAAFRRGGMADPYSNKQGSRVGAVLTELCHFEETNSEINSSLLTWNKAKTKLVPHVGGLCRYS